MNSIFILLLFFVACALCAGSVQIVHVHETNPEMYEEIVLGQQEQRATQTPSPQPSALYLNLSETNFYYVYIAGSVVVIVCLLVWRIKSALTQTRVTPRINKW